MRRRLALVFLTAGVAIAALAPSAMGGTASGDALKACTNITLGSGKYVRDAYPQYLPGTQIQTSAGSTSGTLNFTVVLAAPPCNANAAYKLVVWSDATTTGNVSYSAGTKVLDTTVDYTVSGSALSYNLNLSDPALTNNSVCVESISLVKGRVDDVAPNSDTSDALGAACKPVNNDLPSGGGYF